MDEANLTLEEEVANVLIAQHFERNPKSATVSSEPFRADAKAVLAYLTGKQIEEEADPEVIPIMDDVVKGLVEAILKAYGDPVSDAKELDFEVAQAALTYLTSKGWGPVGEMREAVSRYLSEHDNPAPDYTLRKRYREELRAAITPKSP